MSKVGPKDHVVYILGAGFSAPLGIPVMSNFIEKSKDLYASGAEQFKFFADVYKKIDSFNNCKNYYSADLFNIEEIMSLWEMESFASKSKSGNRKFSLFQSFIKEVIESTMKECPIQINHFYPGGNLSLSDIWFKYFGFVLQLWNAFLTTVSPGNFKFHCQRSHHKYSVLSLNYDCVLETCFEIIQRFGSTCIIDDMSSICIKKIGFKKDKYESASPCVHLAKLHGCLDTQDTIIPPTWRKGNNNKQAVSDAWSMAREILQSANHIRVLGYSLPDSDSYLKYLLKTSVCNSSSRVNLKSFDVICQDPDGSVRERYRKFITFGPKRFLKSDVKDYLPDTIKQNDSKYNNEYVCRIDCANFEQKHEKMPWEHF